MPSIRFLLLLVTGAALLSAAVSQIYTWKDFDRYNSTSGFVEAVRTSKLPQAAEETGVEAQTKTVVYGFSVDGRFINGRSSTALHGNQYAAGEIVEVFYDPISPSESTLGPIDTRLASRGAVLVALITVLGVYLVVQARPTSKIQL